MIPNKSYRYLTVFFPREYILGWLGSVVISLKYWLEVAFYALYQVQNHLQLAEDNIFAGFTFLDIYRLE